MRPPLHPLLIFRFLPPLLFLLPFALLQASPAILTPETLIADPAHAPAWTALFAKLSPQKTRFSQFEEQRFFPFRKTPVILHGEIRLAPDRGLSLRYLGDQPHLVIVDQKGVLLRDADGRERAAPNDRRADAVTSALFAVLRFDLPALAREFTVHGTQQDDDWALAFDPHDANVAKFVGSIVVHGHADRLDHLEMFKSEKQHIDISLRDTQSDVVFTPDELRRYFR